MGEILSLNNISDPTRLRAGQKLRIPGARGQEFIEHHASRGETLYGIAGLYGIPLETLRKDNGLSPGYVLKAGDILKIPSRDNPPAPDAEAAHSVSENGPVWPIKAKDIAYMTGKLYGVTLLGIRSEKVESLTSGVVVSAGPYRGFGKVAIVQKSGGYLYVYGGCESLRVKEGDKVVPGTEIGALGIDSLSEKPQLYLVVYQDNKPIDPASAPRS